MRAGSKRDASVWARPEGLEALVVSTLPGTDVATMPRDGLAVQVGQSTERPRTCAPTTLSL